MSVKRRRFTAQFKAKVALEAIKGQRTIGELAGLYQVHPSRIAAWKKHLVCGFLGARLSRNAPSAPPYAAPLRQPACWPFPPLQPQS